MVLSDVVFILCRPSEPGNTGAVCRALKNMGLDRLRLVAPAPMDEELVRARAVHAGDVWERAQVFDSLESAAADCSLVIGTTRRRGRRRKSVTMTPWEAAAYLRDRPGPAALVFGNERTGLEGRELALCNLASHIPADGAFPSLNLSHAVQIYAYELFTALAQAPDEPKGRSRPLDQDRINALVHSVSASLESVGFYRHPGREDQERFFRDIFSRAALNPGEGRYLENIFAKMARLAIPPSGKPPLPRI
ncbi:MAG: TrmJ/YjtD family RNA methyltransferase [Spirochaetaceae bacterium]|jgi:tRNA/rRNA methyltransferase/tRNA (cytidine32/uridine32-2'-O)-methyltransferase|nr:TrmJ/YjtD family RNA methyltransferase [Spirochaetaceae bacterium]